jgi:hypothetical protein
MDRNPLASGTINSRTIGQSVVECDPSKQILWVSKERRKVLDESGCKLQMELRY